MATKKMDLRKYGGLDILDIEMRSLNGHDHLDAAARCVPPDGGQIDGNIFVMLLRQQAVAQAIVSYTRLTGELVEMKGQTCLESIGWSGRTREFVGELFDHLNGVRPDEREDFRKALTFIPGSDGTVSAGSTSPQE